MKVWAFVNDWYLSAFRLAVPYYYYCFLVIYLFILVTLGTSFPKALEIMKVGKNHDLGVSRLATGHFHIHIAEWIGEADCNKALDRNRKALEKEKCLSWVIGVGWNAMALSRNEVHTNLIEGTDFSKAVGEMIITGDFRVFFFLALGRRFSCWGCTSRCCAEVRGGHSVSNCDVPSSAATIAPLTKSETIARLLSDLSRPCGSLINGKPAFDNARQIK